MPAKTHGYYLQRGIIKCQVESFIPFTLRFSRDGGRLGVDQLFRWAAAVKISQSASVCISSKVQVFHVLLLLSVKINTFCLGPLWLKEDWFFNLLSFIFGVMLFSATYEKTLNLFECLPDHMVTQISKMVIKGQVSSEKSSLLGQALKT